MSQSVVAKRYAKALFEVALEKNLIEEVEKDLQVVADTFAASDELTNWVAHPSADAEMKKEVLAKSFKGLNEITLNLLYLLADRRRESIIQEVAQEYKSLSLEHKGVAEAIVTSAYPLTKEDKEQVLATFKPLIGKEIEITEKVNSDILGGVIVQIGDRLYDGSLKTKLSRFQDRLKGTRIG